MIPELSHRPSAPAEVDVQPVIVSREVLRLGAVSLAGGAAALLAACNVPAVQLALQGPHFIVAPIVFALVAAALPVQLLTLTRPLVREVIEQSTAPALVKAAAAIAVSGGSVLTALAWWHAVREMCGVA